MKLRQIRGRRCMPAALIIAALAIPLAALAQDSYHGRKAWTLQNDKLKVIVTPGGGHIASMTLVSGRASNLNPFWLPPWKSAEPGVWERSGGEYGDRPGAPLLASILGHNICLDFFGGASEPEAAQNIPAHGEAPAVNWKEDSRSGNQLVYSANLPAAQMDVTRTIKLAPNSSAIWITETVENRSRLDRPFGWQQHPSFGPPFLEEGASYFDMPAKWSMTYPKEFSKGERLKRNAEFTWPRAPKAGGGTVDLRNWPVGTKSSDYTASLIDPELKHGWFTAINTKKGLLVGYIWPREDWPWVGNWEEMRFRDGKPWMSQAVVRGMEFGTTPWPDSRRDMVTLGKLHGVPTYRWISAKEKQSISYAGFVAPIPEGTTGVREVTLDGDRINIRLNGSSERISLAVRK